ncbi:MAG: hypothetical protein JJT96_03070 [Opitutales bacterium]|nr:hypothetical protein [Opitutales bacterium]
MVEEYYIRSAESETARGPYTIEKLVTLAESGQISPQTLYYDDNLESWAAIGSSHALRDQVFPQRKTLSLRKVRDSKKEKLNEDATSEPVKVDELLAAAEGTTEETRFIREKRRWEERSAAISIPAIGTLLLLSALSLVYPSYEIVASALEEGISGLPQLLQTPLVLFGIFDLIGGVIILLGATEFFPALRLRAMLGAGFLGFMFMAQFLNGYGDGAFLAISSMLFGLGLFVSTLTLHFRLLLASIITAGLGVAGFIYFANIAALLF